MKTPSLSRILVLVVLAALVSQPGPAPVTLKRQNPGVYVTEIQSFPASVAPVATAIPAFIGYTAGAERQGQSLIGKPVRIESLRDYLEHFGARTASPGRVAALSAWPSAARNSPTYHPVAVAPGKGDVDLGGTAYSLIPDPGTIYHLYDAMRLFFENGGGSAYVVSVGTYGPPTGRAGTASPLVNPNVRLDDLRGALDPLSRMADVTLVVIPDAALLSLAENGTLMEGVLLHCGRLGDRMAIFDVIGGAEPDPARWQRDIAAFRTGTGNQFLDHGAAYYPFLETTTVQATEVGFHNLGGGLDALERLLPDAGTDEVKRFLEAARRARAEAEVRRVETALRAASPSYARLHAALLAKMNVQPPGGAIAGIYALVDERDGVWKAPANVTVVGAVEPTIHLTDTQQAGLNVDPVSGKSINAIRLFPNRGVLVWGARTLAGNSSERRYVSVRRTMIMIEQSARQALAGFVFEPNDANTWASVKAMLESFLGDLWRQGALMGASASVAYDVSVGLGTTMTAHDISTGILNVRMAVALVRPGEFVIITVSQKMATG